MVRNRLADIIKIDFTFAIFVSAVILLVPLRLALSWMLAVFIHECSHYLALRLCCVQIYGIRLRCFGVIMDTAPMTKVQELFCALAGPCGGLCLLFFARWLPFAAICAFVQSIFNLLPIFPMDGGRVLRCILVKVFGSDRGLKFATTIHTVTLFLVGIGFLYIAWMLDVNLLSVFFIEITAFVFMKRKLPCKHGQLIVQ